MNNSNENISMRSNNILELSSYIQEIKEAKENIITEDINKVCVHKEESLYKDYAKRMKERVQEEILC